MEEKKDDQKTSNNVKVDNELSKQNLQTPNEANKEILDKKIESERQVLAVSDAQSQAIKQLTDSNQVKTDAVKIEPIQKHGWATFAFVLSILSFVGMFLGAFCTFSFLFVILYYFVLVIIALFTLFLLLLNDTFRSYLDGGETLNAISNVLATIGVYICSGVIAMGILSILILAFSKKYQNKVVGIVLSSIAIFVSILTIIIHYAVPVMANS